MKIRKNTVTLSTLIKDHTLSSQVKPSFVIQSADSQWQVDQLHQVFNLSSNCHIVLLTTATLGFLTPFHISVARTKYDMESFFFLTICYNIVKTCLMTNLVQQPSLNYRHFVSVPNVFFYFVLVKNPCEHEH